LDFVSKINLEQIENIAEKYKLNLVYLFGSKVLGIDSKLSDVDIAILINDEEKDLKKLVLDLIFEFSQIFQPIKVDLTILNKAGYTFQYNVISQGIILYKRTEEIKSNYETRIIKLYIDFKRYETEYFEAMHDSIMQE